MDIIDLVGTKFGDITVIKCFGVKRTLASTARMWECQCKCGKVALRSTGEINRSIKRGGDAACRLCCQISNKTKKPGEASWNMYYGSYRSGAEKRDLDFPLSKEYFQYICSQNCHYCNSEPKPHNRYITKDNVVVGVHHRVTAEASWIRVNGIDRVNSSIGYLKENCVPCCMDCNYLKLDLDYHDFLKQIKSIYEYLVLGEEKQK